MHTRHFPFFFGTTTTLESHSKYWISLMKPASSGLSTSCFITSCRAQWNRLILYWTSLQLSCKLSRCSANSGKTLGMSASNQAKTSTNSLRRDIEATSSMASKAPKFTCLGLLRLNKECNCRGSTIFISPLCGRLSLEHSLLFDRCLTVMSVKCIGGLDYLLVSTDVDMSLWS